jgi:Protein of unknown function (DUF3078)
MKLKAIISIVFIYGSFEAVAIINAPLSDSASTAQPVILNLDTLLENYAVSVKPTVQKSIPTSIVTLKRNRSRRIHIDNHSFDSLATVLKVEQQKQNPPQTPQFPLVLKPIVIDSLVLNSSPFFIHLVFQGYQSDFNWRITKDLNDLFYEEKNNRIILNKSTIPDSPESILLKLRQSVRNEISRTATHLYAYVYTDLPDPSINRDHYIQGRPIRRVKFINENPLLSPDQKLKIRVDKPDPWTKKATGLAQFSQNYASANWYQGANSNVAVLGNLAGKLNYNDGNYIQWDNDAEWRMGFNTVSQPALRSYNTNDDILRATSKLGVKAGGKFFYSASVDFSTQLFDNYKSITSTELKSTFFTPVRFNIGLGLDYKVLSLMVSPFSYKYIYMNDVKNLSPNLFGIAAGKNVLSEVGSALKVLYTYSPMERVLIDTKFSFYTNYTKVEVDWETVCTLTINRFLSTRISLNPRYDNTIIGETQWIQFKQLMSVGFSYKFIN